MRRTRSLFGAAVICSMLLSSAHGDRPERKTYLRRLVDDSLASGLSTLEQLMTASIVSGTGSDAATAAKATAGGQENAARTAAAAAAKKDDDSTATTSTTASTATDDDSVATDDDDSIGDKKTSTKKKEAKAKASPPPNLSVNVTQTDESPADWYDDDGSATMAVGNKADAPASAGSTSGSAAGTTNTGATTSTSSNTTLPNGRAHLDTNNPHRAEMKRNNPDGIHNSTNDDDDAGYIHHNATSNEDYVVGDDDDSPKTITDAIFSDISKKSKKMSMSTREGYVVVFVVLVAAAGFGSYLATKRCRRMMKQQGRRSGYQAIE